MATLHISFRITGEEEVRKIHPTRNNPPLLSSEIDEHPHTLSNEIWDMIEDELKGLRLTYKLVDRNSVSVSIDTDDNQTLDVPSEVILQCFHN